MLGARACSLRCRGFLVRWRPCEVLRLWEVVLPLVVGRDPTSLVWGRDACSLVLGRDSVPLLVRGRDDDPVLGRGEVFGLLAYVTNSRTFARCFLLVGDNSVVCFDWRIKCDDCLTASRSCRTLIGGRSVSEGLNRNCSPTRLMRNLSIGMGVQLGIV